MIPKKTRRPVFRSQLEQRIANDLDRRGVHYQYESLTLEYQRPPSKYTPDFVLPNGIILEAKGHLSQDDRKKMKLVKDQHPEMDIRFIFQNANNKIRKGSKTTYAAWADRWGFQWAENRVPEEWLREERA